VQDSRREYSQDDSEFSRAYTKLRLFDQSVKFGHKLAGKVVLDVGSSTGGFTNFALEKGAKKVIAIEIGSRQMDARLLGDHRVRLYEKTDILNVVSELESDKLNKIVVQFPDVALMDVSFVSARNMLLHLRSSILGVGSVVVLLFKPQFEAKEIELINGIVKNSKIRRSIIKSFELWLNKNKFMIEAKKDSELAGSKGNVERLYVLKIV
jgi:23S rRNA (cytidine1920-2'-O)/16S rRNA (cytidine1409-2'-O)-methyltransferase